MNGENDEKGSGHGMAKGGQANKARRTRPLQATQPANGLPGTGLEVNNSQQMKLVGLLPCSAGWWRECGGAGHSGGGLGPT